MALRTTREGTQNGLYAQQGAVGAVGLLAGRPGAGLPNPPAAHIIGAVALNEGAELRRRGPL